MVAAASISPPRRPPVPRTMKPSSVASRSPPEAVQPVDDGRDAVGLLDLQLLGAAHDGLPLGEAAEQRDERQLVDRQRHLVGLDRRASSGPAATSRSLTGSWPGIVVVGRVLELPTTTPPMRSRIRTKPMRVQLTLTFLTSEPRVRDEHAAAVSQNAALDASPGTTRSLGLELVGGRDREVAPVRCSGTPMRGEHALGVVAAGLGLDDRRRALGGDAREQDAATSPARWPPAARSRARQRAGRGR